MIVIHNLKLEKYSIKYLKICVNSSHRNHILPFKLVELLKTVEKMVFVKRVHQYDII